jgi:ATP-binding cassette subfamily B multidrug efflux pump
MDRILYMEQGQVIESGSHQQLLEKQGGYAQLWQHQVAGYESESTTTLNLE